MGMFDNLEKLNKKQQTAQQKSQPENLLPIQKTQPSELSFPENQNSDNPENLKTRNPDTLKSGKPENLKTGKPDFVKAEKYSTQLQPDLIKQVKQFAIEHDMKDYEVVQIAIREYINKK